MVSLFKSPASTELNNYIEEGNIKTRLHASVSVRLKIFRAKSLYEIMILKYILYNLHLKEQYFL